MGKRNEDLEKREEDSGKKGRRTVEKREEDSRKGNFTQGLRQVYLL